MLIAVAAIVIGACASDGSGSGALGEATEPPADGEERALRDTLSISATGAIPFDQRLLGTNVPAWLGPERLSDPEFVEATLESGTTLIRMPGGSWSNAYDFNACELSDDAGCSWTWAARPTDFANYLRATGLPGIWTVSINQSAQHSAAAVAFFNGEVGDQTPIGVDRYGFDWDTVDTWASLRAAGGNREPVRIDLWEIGNEVYGGKAALAGDECASFGWEWVWTCSGTAYVEGDDNHDGYLAIRRAMLAVDDTIEIGAVGVPDPAAWSNWGNEVLDAVGDEIDFYIVHNYGFDSSPDPSAALTRPREIWPSVFRGLDRRLGDVPIAVTEYNLVSVNDGDTEQSMTRVMNAFYLADTIGQLALLGGSIANQWNLAGGVAESGTNYGLIDVDNDNAPTPQYEAMRTWSTAGSILHPVLVSDSALRVYPTRHDDGRWTIILLNLSDVARTRSVEIDGLSESSTLVMTGVSTDDLTATSFAPPVTTSLGDVEADGSFAVDIPGYSINVIEVTP
jgi:hypothetical protein